jgi:D-xylose 1-dehydrogenase (NADP+, D-xylono-1,5-lactone-forming)
MSSERVLRWGVLGCADIALRRLIPAMHATPENKVVAIGSRDLARAQSAANALAIPRAYGSYAEVVADEEVDAIYIPLPNSLHAEWAVRSTEAGKHVLVEKPMAGTVAECEQMVAAARKAGTRLMEAFMYRFHPQHARVRQLLSSGAIGELRMLRTAFCARMQRPPADFRFSPDLGGGALLDLGVYAIDAARWLVAADPISVSGSVVLGARGIDVSAAAVLTFPNATLATVACSFIANGGGTYELVGSEGKLTLHQAFAQPAGRPPTLTLPNGDLEVFDQAVNHYELMLSAYASAILANTPLPIAPEDGIANIRVIESVRTESLTRGELGRPQ